MRISIALAVAAFAVTHSTHAQLQISEIMASNTRAYPDITDFEDYPDWIELKNSNASDLNLGGYFLSDDPAQPFKWAIPASATVPAGGHLLIIADAHDAAPGQVFPRGYWPWKNFTTEKYHTNFGLSSTGETIVLTQVSGISSVNLVNASTPPPVAPATVATWKYKDDGSDQSTQWRARNFDDSAWAAGPAELGYGDAPATTVSYGPSSTNKHITTYFRHSFNVADPTVFHGLTLNLLVDDGCVIYLNGNEIVRRNMPDGDVNYKTLATTTVSGTAENTFFTYNLSSANLVAGANVLAVEVHQSVADSSDLSFDLNLTASSHTGSTLVDTLTFGQQVPDVSFGRDAANPAVLRQFAEPTPGAVNSSSLVDDIRVTGNAVVVSLPSGFYNTDQSITLSAPSGVVRYTLDGSNPKPSSPVYSAPILVNTTTVLRAQCFETGKAPGPIETRTYFFGETPGDIAYVSVVADPETLFGNTIGIYKNEHETVTGSYGLKDVYKGKDAPGNIEFFGPGGTFGFTAGCGIRVGGENNWVHPQKALNLSVRGKYGTDEISYDLFPGSQIPLHTALTLRDGGDNWDKDMLRDAIFPKLAPGYLNVDTADYRPSVVFINGAYFGIHDIRARWDDAWFAQHYHVPSDKIDHLLYGHITSTAVTLGVDKGGTADWLDLIAFINTADLTVPANWAYLESKIDMDSFMDFVISESYGNNTAWHHNREFWRSKLPGGKWRWFLADMDRTFSTSKLTGILADMLNTDDVLVKLKANTGFKQRLAQRYAAHMAGTFNAARVQSIVSAMDAEVAPYIPRHVTRWAPNGTTVATRASNIQQIKDYATQRAANFAAEVSIQLGVGTPVNFTLGLSDPNAGRVLVQGVPVGASTFPMFPNIAFSLKAVAAPGYAFSHWIGIAGGQSVNVTLSADASVSAVFVPSTETIVGGTLPGSTTFTQAASPYTLASDLIVPPGATLTLQAGVIIDMPAGRNIRVQGSLAVAGTAAQKVTIRGRNGDKWGAISLENPTAPCNLAHLIIRGATKGYDATKYSSALTGRNTQLIADFIDIAESEGPFYMIGGNCTVRDSVFHNPYTGDGLHVKKGSGTVQRCVFRGNNAPDTDAIDFDGVTNGLIEDCHIYRFQGSNSDGIDIGESSTNLLIQNNRIYFNSDKGVSVGQGSTAVLRKNLIVGCNLGIGVKDSGSLATVDQNTFAGCATGIAVYEKNFGSGGGSAVVTNTIISKASLAPTSADNLSTLSITYSMSDTVSLGGVTNRLGDPQFVDAASLNYQLKPASLAINSGDPAHALDPDGTRVDIGAAYAYTPADYPFTIFGTVVINEILANSGASSDWIELHNRTASSIDIGGWFLSDSGADLLKYRIAPGTVIPAGGYLVFREDTHFGAASIDPNKITPFALSDIGETVYLSSAVNDELTDYQSKEDFGPTAEGETLGTYYKPSTDSYNFVALKRPTPNAPNCGPRVGPIVISEIMYNPAGNGDAEYFELLNVSNAPVTLFDSVKGKPWRVSDGIDFEFPSASPVTMAPGERIVLTKNLAQFTVSFGALVPAGTKVFEWSSGGLDNGGETLQLDRPGAVDALNVQQYVRQDRVNYDDVAPWPKSPDGSGPSLTKICEKAYGNDAVNWMASTASPGSITAGSRYATWAAANSVSSEGNDDDGDGSTNLMEYVVGTDPHKPSPIAPLILSTNPGQPMITFQVNSLLPDVDYFLESSSDLHEWNVVDPTPVQFSGGMQTETYTPPAPLPSHLFFRLRPALRL